MQTGLVEACSCSVTVGLTDAVTNAFQIGKCPPSSNIPVTAVAGKARLACAAIILLDAPGHLPTDVCLFLQNGGHGLRGKLVPVHWPRRFP